MINKYHFLPANWSVPNTIRALTTYRTPGHSQFPYDNNNLGLHVGDRQEDVLANRELLRSHLSLPSEPSWLDQTHSNHCVVPEEESNRNADAAITRSTKHVLAILTADCLPILLCNKQGTEIAAVHAGWRGLVNGVIENTINQMKSKPTDIIAWIGPAICQNCYEVGDDMRVACQEKHPFAREAFRAKKDKWLANLPLFAELILKHLSISVVYQSRLCTFEQKTNFFSYRREKQTGRIATLIWFDSTPA